MPRPKKPRSPPASAEPGSSDSLEVAAETLGLQVQQSPWISRGDAESWPLAEPRVVETAFSPEVLGEGLNSEILELAEISRPPVMVEDNFLIEIVEFGHFGCGLSLQDQLKSL